MQPSNHLYRITSLLKVLYLFRTPCNIITSNIHSFPRTKENQYLTIPPRHRCCAGLIQCQQSLKPLGQQFLVIKPSQTLVTHTLIVVANNRAIRRSTPRYVDNQLVMLLQPSLQVLFRQCSFPRHCLRRHLHHSSSRIKSSSNIINTISNSKAYIQ
jgi:hypothetical protein